MHPASSTPEFERLKAAVGKMYRDEACTKLGNADPRVLLELLGSYAATQRTVAMYADDKKGTRASELDRVHKTFEAFEAAVETLYRRWRHEIMRRLDIGRPRAEWWIRAWEAGAH